MNLKQKQKSNLNFLKFMYRTMRFIVINIISILLLLSIGNAYAQTTKESLLARQDVLTIIVIDVEFVGF